MTPEDNVTISENTEVKTELTQPDADAELKAAVTLADSIAATSRDKKNTAITLLTSTAEEKETVSNFFRKVKLQADSSKKIYRLSVDAARARNAGKPVPPSKQKGAKAGKAKE